MAKCGCGINAEKYGKVVFNYDACKFKITKSLLECAQCAIKEFLKKLVTFRRFIENEMDGKGIIVDWNFYCGVHNDIKKPRLNEILIALGVLDYRSKGNWEIFGNDMILNPGNIGGALYFTKRKDVLEFAKIKYGGAHYFCELRKISVVIEKEKFSK